jgi:hypothetical protein
MVGVSPITFLLLLLLNKQEFKHAPVGHYKWCYTCNELSLSRGALHQSRLGSQSAAQARRCRSPRDVAGPKAMCSVAKGHTLFELGDWSSKIVCRKLLCCDVLTGVTLGSDAKHIPKCWGPIAIARSVYFYGACYRARVGFSASRKTVCIVLGRQTNREIFTDHTETRS